MCSLKFEVTADTARIKILTLDKNSDAKEGDELELLFESNGVAEKIATIKLL